MKNIRILVLFAVFFSIFVSISGCNESWRMNAFVENNDIRLQVGGTVHFTYDELTCQMAFSRDNLEFRVQTDNTSDYYSLTLSEIPVEVGQSVSGDLVWTTQTSILTRNNLSLEVIKMEGDMIWFWSSSGRIGVSIKVLE